MGVAGAPSSACPPPRPSSSPQLRRRTHEDAEGFDPPKHVHVPAVQQEQREVIISRATLSAKEREVLKRVLEGHSNWVIARLMDISENTVKFHLKNIFRKLGVSSRVLAAAKAEEMGMI